VQLDGVSRVGQIAVQIRWRSGVITRLTVERYRPGTDSLKTPAEAVDRIHALARTSRYPEIAAQLSVSVNTIRTHMRHLYEKLGAHSRTEAVEQACALGLLAPSSRRP